MYIKYTHTQRVRVFCILFNCFSCLTFVVRSTSCLAGNHLIFILLCPSFRDMLIRTCCRNWTHAIKCNLNARTSQHSSNTENMNCNVSNTHITLVCSTSQTAIVLKINIILLISAIIEKFNSFSVYTASQVRLFLFFTLNRFVIFRKWSRVKEREEVCRPRSSNTLLLTSSLMVKKKVESQIEHGVSVLAIISLPRVLVCVYFIWAVIILSRSTSF